MPGLYHQAGCCCRGPCFDCAADDAFEPTGTIQAPDCPDCTDNPNGCCSFYSNSAGNYVFDSNDEKQGFFDEDDYCKWVTALDVSGPHNSVLVFWKSTRKWYAVIVEDPAGDSLTGTDNPGDFGYGNFWGDEDQTSGPAYVKRCKDVTGNVSCDPDTGAITGSYTLEGVDCWGPPANGSGEGCFIDMSA